MKNLKRALTLSLLLILIIASVILMNSCLKPEHECSFVTQDTGAEHLKSAATCTEAAVYFKSCECGINSTETFVFGSPLGHQLTNHPAVAPTETAVGSYEYWTCDRCNEYFYDADGIRVITDKSTITIPMLEVGHVCVFDRQDPTNSYSLVSEASCTAAAVYKYVCACGLIGTDTYSYGDVLAHEFDEESPNPIYLVSPADCFNSALYYHSCECGLVGTTVFEYGEPNPHDASHNDAHDATCSTLGNLEYWHCDNCGKYFSDTDCEIEVTLASLTVPIVHVYEEIATVTALKSAATCTEAAIYYKSCECGRKSQETFIYGTHLGHAWQTEDVVEATCQNGGYTLQTCSNDGCNAEQRINQTSKTACDETYAVSTPASCGVTGIGVYTCGDCNGTREVVIPALSHDYTASITAPGCDVGGYTTYTCGECGDSYVSEQTDALGHDWEITESVDATCTADGHTTSECQICHETSTVTVPALGHTEVDATCESDAYCSACSTVLGSKLGHNWTVSDDVAPTCTSDGHILYDCIRDECNATKKEVPETYKATGHDEDRISWTETKIDVEGKTCTYYTLRSGECPVCEQPVEHKGAEETVHKYSSYIITEATCSADGLKGFKCTECDDIQQTYSEIEGQLVNVTESYSAPDAHNWNGNECTICHKTKTTFSEGSGTVSSSELGNELEFTDASLSLDADTQNQIGDQSIDLSVGTVDNGTVENMASSLTEEQKALLEGKTVYNFEMNDAAGEPITEFDGFITVKIPYELGDEDPDDIVVWYLVSTYIEGEDRWESTLKLVDAEYIEIDGEGYAVFTTNHFSYYTVTRLTPEQRCEKFGHNYIVTNVDSTCLYGGYTLSVCLRCQHNKITNETAPLGHSFKLDEATRVEMNCTTDGYEKHVCETCSVFYEIKTEAPGHDWELVNKIGESCENAGSESFKCNECDETRTVVIPKLTHSYTVTVTAPTCTTGGYTTKKCELCSKEEVSDYTSPLGHNDEATVTEPNCTRGGYTSHYCDRCETVYSKDNHTPKSSHSWNVNEPDCSHDKHCRHCNTLDTTSANGGRAFGHKFHGGICETCHQGCDHEKTRFSHTKNASCADHGYRVHICEVCSEFVNKETLDKAPHDYSLVAEYDATCISPAYKIEVCSNCNDEKTTYFGDVISHSFSGNTCTFCGKVENYFYINLVETFANSEGFAININNFSYEAYASTENNYGILSENGYIKASVAKLMLGLDDEGELIGAANATVVIFNGPIDGEVTLTVELLIEDGKVYINVVSDYAPMNVSMSVEVDFLIDMLLAELSLTRDEFNDILKVIETEALPVIEAIKEANADKINEILDNLFNMLFTRKRIDGGYEYYLDFNKLLALNYNLENVPVAELIDLYFGEGSYDALAELVHDISNVKMKDLPEYCEGLGITKDTLINAINSVAAAFGAPESFDIEQMLNRDGVKDCTLGEMMFGENYEDNLDKSFEIIEETSVYRLFINSSDLYREVLSTIKVLKDLIGVSFTANSTGTVLDYGIDCNDFVVSSYNSNNVINFEYSCVFDGVINVDWQDISNKINGIPMPPADEDYSFSYTTSTGWGSDTMTYEDTEYSYNFTEYRIQRFVEHFSTPSGFMVRDFCGNWKTYEFFHLKTTEVYFFELRELALGNGEYIYLIVDDYGNCVRVYFDEDADTVSYIEPDGSMEILGPAYAFTPEMLETLFGELSWQITDVSSELNKLYYNVLTKEVSYNKTHNYELTDSKEAVGCTDGYDYYVCSECNNSYYSYHYSGNHDYEIDYDNSVIPDGCNEKGYYRYVCSECGDYYDVISYSWHDYQYVYSLADGSDDCTDGISCEFKCTRCNDSLWFEENYGTDHDYKDVITLSGNKLSYKTTCSTCGDVIKSGDLCDIYAHNGIISVYNDRDDYATYVKFVPDVTGLYEIYSYGMTGDPYARIYNSAFASIDYSDDDGYGVNFGMLCELTAGKTYYIRLLNCRDGNVYIHLHDDTEDVKVSLADYGCECGSTVEIIKAFGYVTYTVNNKECDTDCQFYGRNGYFSYYLSSDENCDELYSVRFYNYNLGQYVSICSIKTGKKLHEGYDYNPSHDEYTYVNDAGETITVERSIYTHSCRCGTVTEKEEYLRHYNSNGDKVLAEDNYYEYSYELECLYLCSSSKTEYIEVTYASGYSEVKQSLSYDASYNQDGDVEFWSSKEYTYNGCYTQTVSKNSYGGTPTIHSWYNHSENRKYLPDESGTSTVTEDGKTLTVTTEAYEEYCTKCLASIEKRVYTEYTDENGVVVRLIDNKYLPYANSATDTGYRISTSETKSYIDYEYESGKYRHLISSDKTVYYDDAGNETDWEMEEYKYSTSCEYEITFSNKYSGTVVSTILGSNHETYREYRLRDGSTSCTDGVEEWQLCKYCDYSYHYDYTYYYHEINRNEMSSIKIDLSDYGSECGGYALISTCACGQESRVDTYNIECDLDHDHFYGSSHDEKLSYYIDIYSCAVTDTAEGRNPCEFVYTRETWEERGSDCSLYSHTRYVFGSNSSNPYVYETVVKTSSYSHQTSTVYGDTEHTVEDGFDVYTTRSETVCSICGSTTSDAVSKEYYDAMCNWQKTICVTNSYRIDGTKSSSRRTERTGYYFGDLTEDGITYEVFISYNTDGTVSNCYEDISDYAFINGVSGDSYSFKKTLHRYNTYYTYEAYTSGTPSYWYEYAYSYVDTGCIYNYTETYRNSYGENRVNVIDYHQYYTSTYTEIDPTCTQSGVLAYYCTWCGEKTGSTTVSPTGHNYSGPDADGIYQCIHCDLQNFVGADGNIVLEDLTWKHGNGENYVIGYYVKNDISYDIRVSVIVNAGEEDEDELLITSNLNIENDGNMIFVNIESLKNAIDTLADTLGENYSICTEMVRICFVASDDTSSFDYAITLDPHVLSYSTDSAEEGEMPHTHSAHCTECDEPVLEAQECDFILTSYDEYEIEGVEHVERGYTCRHCSNSYKTETWTELTDAECCEYTVYTKTSWADGSNTESYSYTSHNYSYTCTDVGIDETTGISVLHTHSYMCLDCGNSSSSSRTGHRIRCSYSYKEGGVEYNVACYYCYSCDFVCKVLSYSALTDADVCEYTRYYTYYINPQIDGTYESMLTAEEKFYSHNLVYTHNATETNSFTHSMYCEDCGYSQDSASCSMTLKSSKATVTDGTIGYASEYYCEHCGFEYTENTHTVCKDDCTETVYKTYEWYEGAEKKTYSTSSTNTNHRQKVSYEVNSDGTIDSIYHEECYCGANSYYSTKTRTNLMHSKNPLTFSPDSSAGNIFTYKFTPDKSGEYALLSDYYVSLFITAEDNCADYSNYGYSLFCNLEAGKTYYIRVYSDYSFTNTYFRMIAPQE